MKKLLLMTLILTLVMSFSFTGCGGNAADDNDDNTAVEQTQDDADDKDDADDQNDDENDDSDADDQNDTDDQDDDDDDDKAPVQNNQSSQNNAGTAQPAPSPAPAPAPQPEVNSAPSKDDAKKYVGKSVSAMTAEIGSPLSSSYAPSCMGDGEDGELKYSGFTVYTYREAGQEKVIDVE